MGSDSFNITKAANSRPDSYMVSLVMEILKEALIDPAGYVMLYGPEVKSTPSTECYATPDTIEIYIM